MTHAEFEELFRKYFTLMAKIAYHIVRDEDTANDIVQQVFIKLWEKKETLKITSSEKSYLHRAVVNTALNYLEKTKRTDLWSETPEHEQASGNTIEEGMHEKDLLNAIHTALSKLPPVCRTVFSLSRSGGMSNKEIAEHLNVSIKAVEKHISKALKHLRLHLKPFLNATTIGLILLSLIYTIPGVGFLPQLSVILLTCLA